jgi:hypothetical protein
MNNEDSRPRQNPELRGVAEGLGGDGIEPPPVATPEGDGQRAPSPPQFLEWFKYMRPQFYHRDGTPIEGSDQVLQWGEAFEKSDRRVSQTMTPYGERLSTVFLGLDHSFGEGPPLIFETMLFAPRKNKRRFLSEDLRDRAEYEAESRRIEKRFPHDQVQHRYSTEAEALADHKRLARQCLIPPRWRRFLLYRIAGDETWS